MKRYSASLTTREREMKTTWKYYLTPVQMTIIKEEIINGGEAVEERGPLLTRM